MSYVRKVQNWDDGGHPAAMGRVLEEASTPQNEIESPLKRLWKRISPENKVSVRNTHPSVPQNISIETHGDPVREPEAPSGTTQPDFGSKDSSGPSQHRQASSGSSGSYSRPRQPVGNIGEFPSTPTPCRIHSGDHFHLSVQSYESSGHQGLHKFEEITQNAPFSSSRTLTGSTCRINTEHLPAPLHHSIVDQPEQAGNKTHETSQRNHGIMPRWSLKKRKEAPPRLLQQESAPPQFSRMPSVVLAQPSSMPTGGFTDGTSSGYHQVYYTPVLPQTPVAGFQQQNMPQPSSAPIPQATQGGSSGNNSPTRLKELETMKERLNEMIAQEKASPSPDTAEHNGAGRQGRRHRRRTQEKSKQRAQPASGGPASLAGHSPRTHVCSDCDSLRSGLFQELHGSSERRNFCTDCQIKRLEKHKLNPYLPIEHFCFQCGQARTKEFLKANPEAKKRMMANLCEECLLHSKSRQRVPKSSIIDNNGNGQESAFASVLSSQLGLGVGIEGLMDDEFHSDSTVVGGGTFECYQRLFGSGNAAESSTAGGNRASRDNEHRSRRHHGRLAQAKSSKRGERKHRGGNSRGNGTADSDSGESDSDDGCQPCNHSVRSRSKRPSHGKSRRGRSRPGKRSRKASSHETSRRITQHSNMGNGLPSGGSGGRDMVRGRSKRRAMDTPPESASDDAYDSDSDSSGYDSLSDSSDGTGSPAKKGSKSRRTTKSAASESSSTGCSSENYRSVPNRRSEKHGSRARSSSRVRFNPEVEVQNLTMRGSSGMSRMDPEVYSMNTEESRLPQYVGTLGREPLKAQDGGRATLQEIDINAQREAERRARSQQVYNSMFGSTLGGGATAWKENAANAAGPSNGGPSGPKAYNYQQYGGYSSTEDYGKCGDSGPQSSFAYSQEQGAQYGPYSAAEAQRHVDNPYNGFNYQVYGRGYYRDPNSQMHEAQGYELYGNGQAFPNSHEPTWSEAEACNRHNAHSAHTSSFLNAQ